MLFQDIYSRALQTHLSNPSSLCTGLIPLPLQLTHFLTIPPPFAPSPSTGEERCFSEGGGGATCLTLSPPLLLYSKFPSSRFIPLLWKYSSRTMQGGNSDLEQVGFGEQKC